MVAFLRRGGFYSKISWWASYNNVGYGVYFTSYDNPGTMYFGDVSREKAEEVTNDSCKQLLVNPNTQTYTYEIISWKVNLL